ncbi:MAG: hypothetical protein JW736_06765 [Deltaproteobacteria bacterium]|nr:hypothetical protein [Deltaproteobacteria bacterium]MBN2688170.1 hypothetical protein [Deltaproteobacteria bacterium]
MMRKLTVVFVLLSLVLVWSCGGGSEDKKAPKATAEKTTKKYSLKTQEGMMKKLQEFGISVPAELVFIEITKNSSDYVAKFEKEGIDEPVKAGLDKWYAGLISHLTANGWKKRDVRVNDTMFGAVYNQTICRKPRGGGSTLSDMLDITTVYDLEKKKYTLYVSPAAY